jgi:hypothetical protein
MNPLAPDQDAGTERRAAPEKDAVPAVEAGDAHLRWDAAPLSKSASQPVQGSIYSTVWPTRALNSNDRWFDEIFLWTEGFQASTTQRARIQTAGLESAFFMLEHEHADHVGVTLSFGTIELFTDGIDRVFQAHDLVKHRIVVILRGTLERLRSPYRVRTFIDHLRAQQIPVGYRVSTPRITMELSTLDALKPDFAKITSPVSLRPESWDDLVVGARVIGMPLERIIVAGLDKAQQLDMARKAGIGFGQGAAVRPAFAPPQHRADSAGLFESTTPTRVLKERARPRSAG